MNNSTPYIQPTIIDPTYKPENGRPIRYKAVAPNLTSFRNLGLGGFGAPTKVRWAVGKRTVHPRFRPGSRYPLAHVVQGVPSTYLSTATHPGECTGAQWPLRLFEVQGVGRGTRSSSYLPHKRGYAAVDVHREIEAWQVFGPYGKYVVQVIESERGGRITRGSTIARGKPWHDSWQADSLCRRNHLNASLQMLNGLNLTQTAKRACIGFMVLPFDRELGLRLSLPWRRANGVKAPKAIK